MADPLVADIVEITSLARNNESTSLKDSRVHHYMLALIFFEKLNEILCDECRATTIL